MIWSYFISQMLFKMNILTSFYFHDEMRYSESRIDIYKLTCEFCYISLESSMRS